MDAEGMPLALLVNPHSAHGRTLKLLPKLEQRLDALRVAFRVERTRGIDDGVERALRAVEAGEVPVVLSGDGLIGAVGGALAGSDTPLGIVPGGRGNDLARVLGIPTDPEEAAAVLADARRLRSDLRQAALHPASARAVSSVSRFVERAAAKAFLEPASFGRGPRWSVGGSLERPLLVVAWSAADLLTNADLAAIHACPGAGCGWMFLDPRGRRRWCSMQWCGNRSKVRAHAERQRAAV